MNKTKSNSKRSLVLGIVSLFVLVGLFGLYSSLQAGSIDLYVTISGPTKGDNSGTYTWCANITGNAVGPYTYQWEYSQTGGSTWYPMGTTQCITAHLPLDRDLMLRVTVTATSYTPTLSDTDYHFVINMDA